MKFEKTDIWGFDHALRGMRNPLESWGKSDSEIRFCDYCTRRNNCDSCESLSYYSGQYIFIGENDLTLAKKLIKAGAEHRKFLRQIFVSVDITAPLYWWKEFDTYKIGTTANSTSTMHMAHKRDFKLDDFEFEIPENETKKIQKDVEIIVEKEIWEDIKGYEGYYKISNTGKILKLPSSVIDSNGDLRKYKGRITPTPINSSGYKKCILRKDGISSNHYLHRLLSQTFIDNPNNFPVVNHKDGNKLNCNLKNLEWCSHSDNDIHAVKEGLKKVTQYNKMKVSKSARRFTDEEIIKIFDLFENGYTKKEISDVFECYSSTICNILNGKTYKYIDTDELTELKLLIDELNYYRQLYVVTNDKQVWKKMIERIPSSIRQTRTCTLTYENIYNMYNQRNNHKLIEWSNSFCSWCETLPYFKEFFLE